jgi:hypothetical protein
VPLFSARSWAVAIFGLTLCAFFKMMIMTGPRNQP